MSKTKVFLGVCIQAGGTEVEETVNKQPYVSGAVGVIKTYKAT